MRISYLNIFDPSPLRLRSGQALPSPGHPPEKGGSRERRKKSTEVQDMKIISKRPIAITAFMVFAAFSFAGNLYAKELSPEKIPAVKVCMINNRVMAEQQIPVEIGDKTYYGCCAGCANKLKNEEGARFSKDPLTGNKVDKG